MAPEILLQGKLTSGASIADLKLADVCSIPCKVSSVKSSVQLFGGVRGSLQRIRQV